MYTSEREWWPRPTRLCGGRRERKISVAPRCDRVRSGSNFNVVCKRNPLSLPPPSRLLAPHSHVPLRNCRNCRIADKGRIMRKLETGAKRACAGGRASLARYKRKFFDRIISTYELSLRDRISVTNERFRKHVRYCQIHALLYPWTLCEGILIHMHIYTHTHRVGRGME